MKRFPLTTVCFLVITFSINGQEEKYGKITSDQWDLQKCSFDTTANAIVLFDVGDMRIDGVEVPPDRDPECKLTSELFTLTYDRHIRIKILNKSGLDPKVFTFFLRSIDGKKDKLIFFKGLNLVYENGKEVKTSFGAKDLITEETENGACLKTFEMPEIVDGAILDIIYQVQSPINSETPEWTFSNEFPTIYSEVRISLPDFFRFETNCPILSKLDHEFYSRSKRYSVSYTINYGWKTSYYEYNQNFEKYTLDNIPVIDGEQKVMRLKYVITSMDFIAVKVTRGVWGRKQ